MTMRPILSPSARVRECSPLRVGFAAGAGPMMSARVFRDSEGRTAVRAATLGKAGMESREVEAFAERGSKPSAGPGGVSSRAFFSVESGGAEALDPEATAALAEAPGAEVPGV